MHVVRNSDGDQAGRVTSALPDCERSSEFLGATVMDFRGADRAQPHVAACLDAAVVGTAVLDADLDLRANRDDPAVALALGCIRIGGRDRSQVHPRAAAPSRWIAARPPRQGPNFALMPRQCVRGTARRRRGTGRRSPAAYGTPAPAPPGTPKP